MTGRRDGPGPRATARRRERAPLKVALVHPYPWPEVRRGAERYLDDLSRHLAARGHQVTVVTGTHGAPGVDDGGGGPTVRRRRHVRVRGAGRVGVGEVETFGLAALGPLLRLRPDVVHAFTPSGALAGRLTGRPTLYSVLGHPTADQLPPDPVPRLLFTGAARRATVTAALSRASAEALHAVVGRRALVLPPGVRLDRFQPELRPRTGPPRLLFSASLSDPRKHAELAVAALAALLPRHPSARLVLSGAGDPTEALVTAKGHGEAVAAAVEVAGPGEPGEIPARYRAASVTVLPAEHEAFGLALLESLAAGTPVVCTPCGGMPELVGPGCGRVAGAATPAALAAALEEALAAAARPETPRRCVARARRWDWEETVGPAHEEAYRQMAGGGRPTEVGPW